MEEGHARKREQQVQRPGNRCLSGGFEDQQEPSVGTAERARDGVASDEVRKVG